MAIVGALFGILIGFGMYFLRFRFPSIASALGWVGVIVAAVGGSMLGIAIFGQMSKGGDYAMNAITFALVIGTAILGALGVVVFLAILQRHILGLSFLIIARSLLLEIGLVALMSYGFLNVVFRAAEAGITNEYWQKELKRREEAKHLKDSIPPAYRNMPSQMIDEHNRMRRDMEKQGMKLPPLVPADVEKAIRDAEKASAQPAAASNLSLYNANNRRRTQFMFSLWGFWFLSAVVAPFVFKATIKDGVGGTPPDSDQLT